MSKGKGEQIEENSYDFRTKPEPIPFSKYLYNKDEGTVLGRNGASWGEFHNFYINPVFNFKTT